jgi:hypothetical protein
MSNAATADSTEPSPEDAKLIALARSARARITAASAAAVRDETGRSYVGADVELPSLTLTGLQLAVAQAVAAGATALEGVAVVTTTPDEAVDTAVIADLGGVPAVLVADRSGTVIRTVRT